MRRQAIKILAVFMTAALISSCGFKLRGESPLPFESAYVEAGATSLLAPQLRKYLAAAKKSASSKESAAIVIRLSDEMRQKNVLSLSGTGKVREYRLIHGVRIAAVDRGGREVLAPSLIQLNRDFSYSDEQIMAKEAEETLLHKEMEQDILRQILRRLGYVQTP
jgi:LPS-assembly lipoprotein